MTSTVSIRTILDQIVSGEHDDHLAVIMSTASTRLTRVRGSVEYGIGDRVRFNSACGTKYLIGHTAQVVGKRRTKVVVKLDKPTGRFIRMTSDGPVSAEITVPPAIIDLA
jgi:hypothetical protein